MTVFGRDTLITCLQTLVFGPELAATPSRCWASCRRLKDDAEIDAEPGKIVHEIRHGKTARRWFPAYYGTVDATPLYLILLSEVWRWTDDAALVRSLKGPAMRALEWIERYGDLDGDGFVEYHKRSSRGLDNQSWKDSGDSQRFCGRALCRDADRPLRGAGLRLRRQAALRRAGRDRSGATASWPRSWSARRPSWRGASTRPSGSRSEAVTTRSVSTARSARSTRSARTSGTCSGRASCRRSRVDAIVDRLMGEELWSGWGIRTMSSADAAYNPLSYHNGSVWPHDNSLCAWGLAKYGRWPEAQRIIHRMLGVAKHFEYQLPEVFSGLPRSETPFPIAYPTSARPQAWAAGAPVLLLAGSARARSPTRAGTC